MIHISGISRAFEWEKLEWEVEFRVLTLKRREKLFLGGELYYGTVAL